MIFPQIGLVPVIGDLADFMYKCNTRNALLLENFFLKRQRQRQQDGGSTPLSTLNSTGGEDQATHGMLQSEHYHPPPPTSASTSKTKTSQPHPPILPTK